MDISCATLTSLAGGNATSCNIKPTATTIGSAHHQLLESKVGGNAHHSNNFNKDGRQRNKRLKEQKEIFCYSGIAIWWSRKVMTWARICVAIPAGPLELNPCSENPSEHNSDSIASSCQVYLSTCGWTSDHTQYVSNTFEQYIFLKHELSKTE